VHLLELLDPVWRPTRLCFEVVEIYSLPHRLFIGDVVVSYVF
jgi:hypothetical protein